MEEMTVQRVVCSRIPTRIGQFQLCLYTNTLDDKEHLALILGDVTEPEDVLVRVHSECFTGDVLSSLRCDCGEQLENAMEAIAREGIGVIVYLRQEGRGIGLESKLQAYNLQDQGYDTVDANLALGHPVDPRDYTVAALILKDLGIHSVRLLTNNPEKIRFLEEIGIHVVDRIPSVPTVNSENANYLRTKALRMHHLLNVTGLIPFAFDRKHGSD